MDEREPRTEPAVIDEGERQMILLALAKLALERPGWSHAIGLLTDKLRGRFMFQRFQAISAD